MEARAAPARVVNAVVMLRTGDATAKEAAAKALYDLRFEGGGTLEDLKAKVARLRVAIANVGGIAPLVELLRSGSDNAKKHAAEVLLDLTCNNATAAAVAAAGAIAPLVELVRSGSEGTAEWRASENGWRASACAAAALGSLAAENDANKVAIAEAGAIAPLIELVRSSSEKAKEHAARTLHNLAINATNAAAIAVAGGIEPLVELLRSAFDDTKTCVAEALTNLASSHANQVAIVKAGAISPLLELARSGSEKAKEAAAATLNRLAYNDANAVAIAEAGGSEPLVELVRGGSEDAKEEAAGALMNLADNAAN